MKLIFKILIIFACISCNKKESQNSHKLVSPFVISRSDVRLRENPNLEGRVLSILKQGEEIEIISYDRTLVQQIPWKYPGDIEGSIQGIWVKVKTKDTKIGYIFSKYIGYNMWDRNSISYIARSENASKDFFTIIGISDHGVLRNYSNYFNNENIEPDRIPPNDIAIFSFNGAYVGNLTNIKIAKSAYPENDFEIHISGKLLSNGNAEGKGLLGRSMNSSINALPIIIETQISKKVIEAADQNTNNKIKELFKDSSTKQIKCLAHCTRYLFSNNSRSTQYLITEYSLPRYERPSIDSPFIYRLDVIKNEIPHNLEFYVVTSEQGNISKTIALTDIDGDNKIEIWKYWEGYEWWFYSLSIVQDEKSIPLYEGGGGGV